MFLAYFTTKVLNKHVHVPLYSYSTNIPPALAPCPPGRLITTEEPVRRNKRSNSNNTLFYFCFSTPRQFCAASLRFFKIKCVISSLLTSLTVADDVAAPSFAFISFSDINMIPKNRPSRQICATRYECRRI